MGISVIRPGELGPGEISAWHEMQRRTPSLANPFLSPEFAIAVGRVKPQARVAVLADGPAITGFFPFERRGLRAGVALAPELTLCQGLIHAPGAEWDPRQLLAACRLSVWQFDHLVDGQQPFAAHQSAVLPSPTIDLSGGFGSYIGDLRARSPRFVSGLARRARKLEREYGEVHFEAEADDASALRQLMRWKSDQYRRTGRPDRFAQPWVVELIESLAAARGESFRGMLSVLYAGGKPVAASFNPRFGGVLAGWFTAYDPAQHTYSPGLIQLMRLAEAGAERGIELIDMGKGAKWYKDKVKTGEIPVGEGIIAGHSPLAAAHWLRMASSQRAVRTISEHQRLGDAARWALRRYARVRRLSAASARRDPV